MWHWLRHLEDSFEFVKIQVSVGKLAQFVHRRGSIDNHLEESTSALEGIATQKRYQQDITNQSSNYRTEVRVAYPYEAEGIELTVSGRIDGVLAQPKADDGRLTVIEEIKTTRLMVDDKRQHIGSVDDAQIKLYAAIFCEIHDLDACISRLVYIHPDSFQYETIEERCDRRELQAWLDDTCLFYAKWLRRVRLRLDERNRLANKQAFPYPDFLNEQRETARRIYSQLRKQQHLLLSASTGTGKTITALYPLIKAMGENLIDRAIFTTAKQTGHQIALDTLAELAKKNNALTYIDITAKEKICFTEGMPCTSKGCEFADGYFDRIRDAIIALENKRHLDRSTIEYIARMHKVCPFELTLDAAEWADVVVCDYNYVFDPIVALQRLQTRLFTRNILLVDEAHQLSERTKDMLSCELPLAVVMNAHDDVPHAPIGELLESLVAYFERQEDSRPVTLEEFEIRSGIDEFWSIVFAIYDEMSSPQNVQILTTDACAALIFALFRFVQAHDRVNEEDYIWLYQRTPKLASIRLCATNPAQWIQDHLQEYVGSVRFSGSILPTALYNSAHGMELSPVIEVRSNSIPGLGVFVVPDISTYFRQRDASIKEICELLLDLQQSVTGNWLVAFPSYQYLTNCAEEVEDLPNFEVQYNDMSDDEREEFIDWINSGHQRIGLVVMGGVFAESVDYNSDALAGVVVISPGIPPRSLALEKTRKSSARGYEIAYTLTGMRRVIQSAGRVIRNKADRGIVVLVDPRFTRSDTQAFFPPHWAPQITSAKKVGTLARNHFLRLTNETVG